MHVSVINDQASINNFIHAALCELFDKADTGGDGTISIAEYVAMCDEYGIELTDEHLEGVRNIANEDGEECFGVTAAAAFHILCSGAEE